MSAGLKSPAARPTEPAHVRWARAALYHWPFRRGRGLIYRPYRLLAQRRPFLFRVEGELVVPAELGDYMVDWCFFREHERDAAFQLSLRMVRPGDTVIDVGANLGLWAMTAAARAGESGRVFGFEPVPENEHRLRRNLSLNRLLNVTVIPAAVSDRNGRARFEAPPAGNSGGGTLAGGGRGAEGWEVAVATLDTFCAAEGLGNVAVLKIDVEGGEYGVLRGAEALLRSEGAPAIMVEVDTDLAARFGSSPVAVKALLAASGYRCFVFEGQRLVPARPAEQHQHVDLIALKPHHLARYAALVMPA